VPVLSHALHVTETLQEQSELVSGSSSSSRSGASMTALLPPPSAERAPTTLLRVEALAPAPPTMRSVDTATVCVTVTKIDDLKDDVKQQALKLLKECFPLPGNLEVLKALILKKVRGLGSSSVRCSPAPGPSTCVCW
jgi:hypothetical protein